MALVKFGTALLAFAALSTPVLAQITGITGGLSSTVPLGSVRYARLVDLTGPVVTIPVNGLKNYVFYYEAALLSGTSPYLSAVVDGFIPGGTYRVEYLDQYGNLTTTAGCAPSAISGNCTATYSPTTTFLASVSIAGQPINNGPLGSLVPGISGTIFSSAGGVLTNATVSLIANGRTVGTVKTNGNGFYLFYYTGTAVKGFVPPGSYSVQATSALGCTGTRTGVNYAPSNVSDPTQSTYYVTGASLVNQNLTLPPNACIIINPA